MPWLRIWLRSPVSPLLERLRVGHRFDARDPIEVCDQARQQVNEQPSLIVREAAQDLMIAPKQESNCVRQARFCGLRQCYAAAAPIGRVGRAPNQPVPLHAREHLCHRRLLDLGEAGEITLRAGPAILKRDQHRQMSDAKTKRLEPRFAEAGEPARGETDQMSGRRKHIEFHRASSLASRVALMHTCICNYICAYVTEYEF